MTSPMSPRCANRMIDDMTMRNMAPSTQKVYTYAVTNFARYDRKVARSARHRGIRDYRLHLVPG